MEKGAMKKRISTTPYPGRWRDMPGIRNCPLLFDVRLSQRTKLAAKVLVFEKRRDLHRAWRMVFDSVLSRDCYGVCRHLSELVVFPDGRPDVLEVDPQYYCVIGLCRERLTVEAITHECVHAAFAYSNRKSGKFEWKIDDTDMDEEEICYPAGRIAAAIVKTLHNEDYTISFE